MKNDQAVLSILRDKIISGEFPAGERLVEIPTAELLGVSRTPIRIAFRALAQEGLLVKMPNRGYQVREVSLIEIHDSVEVRGVLEGLAARQAAEKGLSDEDASEFQVCLAQGDKIFVGGKLDEEDIKSYTEVNKTFHALVIAVSGNKAIQPALQLNEHLPLASVNSIVFNPQALTREYNRLHYAHLQHHAVFDAIQKGQGARAEALMKEHAQAALSHQHLFNDPDNFVVIR